MRFTVGRSGWRKFIFFCGLAGLIIGGYFIYGKIFYLSRAKDISSKISLLNYRELPKLVESWPGTSRILTDQNYRFLTGNSPVKRIDREREGFSASLYFSEPSAADDVEKRSATVTFRSVLPMDLSDKVLFAAVQVGKNMVGSGHQRSRAQFELTDRWGKKMFGSKIPFLSANEKTYIALRPTVTEPIPLGAVHEGFDLKNVAQVTVRFIVARYPDGLAHFPVSGKMFMDNIYTIGNFELIVRFFGQPSTERITKARLNLGYQWRKRRWEKEPKSFFVGVNYPWNNYGWDVGRNPYGEPSNSGWSVNQDKLRSDFVLLKSIGIEPVRIYLFFDLRTGLHYTNGQLNGFDKYVRKDIEAIFKIAGETHLKIILVLFDFSIADGLAQNAGEHPELIFSSEKYYFLANLMRPLLKDMDKWNKLYHEPVWALELMNEPENMVALVIPGYFEALKSWFKDLGNIIHNETAFKITLGSHSIVDMQRWWPGLDIDIWQFHFYQYMRYEHEQQPLELNRTKITIPGMIFGGEFEPYNITANLDRLKDNGYQGVLFWNWQADDGFKLSPEQVQEIADWIKANKTKEAN